MISAGNAYKDSSPMMIISGAVKRKLVGSDGMLELDHLEVFNGICKGVYRVGEASEVPAVFAEAYRTAMSGSRGPVLIEVPEDVWLEEAQVDIDGMELEADPPDPVNPDIVDGALSMLEKAELPLILSGGGVAYSHSSDLLVRLAEALQVPVITTGNGRGTIPENHPLCLGRAGFGGGIVPADKALEQCDALLCLGAGLSDMTLYEYILPVGANNITVVNISADCIAPQAPRSDLVLCDVADFLRIACEKVAGKVSKHRPLWDQKLTDAKLLWQQLQQVALNREGDVPPGAVLMRELSHRVEDPIVSVGAGMHLIYPMVFLPCNRPLSFMSTVNFGSMGFGMAASMSAKLNEPERMSIAILGDGDFMMTVQDLETAARENIGIKVFVMNDRQYRVLNVRQKISFQGRIYGTEHTNPNFAKLALLFGCAGYRIEKREDIDPVLTAVLSEQRPVVVDVLIDPEDLPPMNIEANLRMSMG
jgi:acetolactate synthase-1/2/3 large subunit